MAKNNFELAEQANTSLVQSGAQEVEIIEDGDFEMMSMAQYQAAKNMLAERRKTVALQLDGRKLAQVNRIMDAMDRALDKMMDEDVTAMDMKFYAETFDKLNRTLGTTIRLDTVDGTGKAGRLALEVQFGNGTTVRTMVEG